MKNMLKQLIEADPKTGKMPTERQWRLFFLLNPFKFDRTYKDLQKILGVSESAIKKQMQTIKKNYPIIYFWFRWYRRKSKFKRCSMDTMIEDYGQDWFDDKVKEDF